MFYAYEERAVHRRWLWLSRMNVDKPSSSSTLIHVKNGTAPRILRGAQLEAPIPPCREIKKAETVQGVSIKPKLTLYKLKRFSEEDKVQFESAYLRYSKNFDAIQKQLPHKSIEELIAYYYSWKKTDRAKAVLQMEGLVDLKPNRCHNCAAKSTEVAQRMTVDLCTQCMLNLLYKGKLPDEGESSAMVKK
ncbi:REST corepressor 2 [Trichinella britovi]|uniref:REST corepressor 2 n=2 Tax=Trichinella TaxID=6333 RepID=A0A0V1DC57_TRIBR|nr:REST corepressor 2 [Trichinella britovi]